MKQLLAILISVIFSACGTSFNGNLTNLPGGFAIPVSSSTASGNGGTTGIQILSSLSVNTASSSPVAIGNIIFDGTRLLVPDTAGGFPIANNVTFDYLSTTPTFQTTSTTNYGIGSILNVIASSAPTAGQSTLFLLTGGLSGTLSVRNDTNGVVQSTTSINYANYGCASPGPITNCGGTYYGACTTGGGYMRFFSFNTSGAMLSAVTTTNSSLSYNSLNAISCYNGSYLLLVTNYSGSNAYNGFYKYDLSFNLIATDASTSYSYPSALQKVVGIATDGTYLYLQGSLGSGNSYYVVGKATLGNLQ